MQSLSDLEPLSPRLTLASNVGRNGDDQSRQREDEVFEELKKEQQQYSTGDRNQRLADSDFFTNGTGTVVQQPLVGSIMGELNAAPAGDNYLRDYLTVIVSTLQSGCTTTVSKKPIRTRIQSRQETGSAVDGIRCRAWQGTDVINQSPFYRLCCVNILKRNDGVARLSSCYNMDGLVFILASSLGKYANHGTLSSAQIRHGMALDVRERTDNTVYSHTTPTLHLTVQEHVGCNLGVIGVLASAATRLGCRVTINIPVRDSRGRLRIGTEHGSDAALCCHAALRALSYIYSHSQAGAQFALYLRVDCTPRPQFTASVLRAPTLGTSSAGWSRPYRTAHSFAT